MHVLLVSTKYRGNLTNGEIEVIVSHFSIGGSKYKNECNEVHEYETADISSEKSDMFTRDKTNIASRISGDK